MNDRIILSNIQKKLGLVVFLVLCSVPYLTTRTEDITVAAKTENTNDYWYENQYAGWDIRNVITTDGRKMKCTNSLWHMKFNKIKSYDKMQPGKSYRVKTYFGLLGRQIIEVHEIGGSR